MSCGGWPTTTPAATRRSACSCSRSSWRSSCRSARHSAARSCTSTGSTSRRPVTARCGTSRRPTSCRGSTAHDDLGDASGRPRRPVPTSPVRRPGSAGTHRACRGRPRRRGACGGRPARRAGTGTRDRGSTRHAPTRGDRIRGDADATAVLDDDVPQRRGVRRSGHGARHPVPFALRAPSPSVHRCRARRLRPRGQDRGSLEAGPGRRALRATPTSAGASDPPDRRRARLGAGSPWSRCRLGSDASVHVAPRRLRRRCAHAHHGGDGSGPRRSRDPLGVLDAGRCRMTRLQELFTEHGQSPWLDNLTRRYLRDGTLARFAADGIRGVTANPTIFARAIEASDDYDEQFADLVRGGRTVADAYWELVVADVRDACAVLRPTFDASSGTDGFVSIEVAPEAAHDSAATVGALEELHRRVAEPNAFVKIPATPEGVVAIRESVSAGHNVNVTLVFSLSRYAQVIDAYLAGLETFADAGGDLATV